MKFSYTDINDCYNEMNKIVSKMNEIVLDVKSSSETLQKGVWTSQGCDYYCNKLNSVINEYDKINSQLISCLNAINTSVQNYSAVESRIFNQTSGMLRKDITERAKYVI